MLRRLSGKAVALVGLSAGLLSLSSCSESKHSSELASESAPLINNFERQRVAESSSVTQICDTSIPNEVNSRTIKVDKHPITGDIDISDTVKKRHTETTDSAVSSNNEQLGGIAQEISPIFPGGDKALFEWIHSRLEYPQSAIADSIEGRCIVQFVVKTDGSVGDVKVLRPLHPALDSEAVKVVRTLPDFQPGQINGIVVDLWYTVPIVFKLPVNNENSPVSND